MHSLAVLETRRLKPRCWKGYTPLEVLWEDQFLLLPASCGSKCSFSCGCFSITKSCLTLWDTVCCSTPGFPVFLYIPKFAQTHVHWVSDAIQLFHPLSPPCPTALHFSHHEGFFQWVGSLHQVAKVLELQLWHQSFQRIFGLISFKIDWFDLLAVKGFSRMLSSATARKHEFLSTQPSLWSNSHICTWLLEKP